MKILITCDERSSSEKFYRDLERAGLPERVEVYILSVADVCLVPCYETTKSKSPFHKYVSVEYVEQEVKRAKVIADGLTKKLKVKLPHWHFHAEAAAGSPAWEILSKAQEWAVDLIVVGSHGRIGVGELFFGSVALQVLSEAPCSVRIVRKDVEEVDSPPRIVVGVDGSKESDTAIDIIRTRHWKKGSAVHLVTAVNTVIHSLPIPDVYAGSTIFFIETIPDDLSIKKEWRTKGRNKHTAWIKKMHEEYKIRLQNTGLIVSSLIKEGDPKVVLLQEAKKWGAECIFMGALGYSKLDRLLIGSVSTAIAARAKCSVEIIRNLKKENKGGLNENSINRSNGSLFQ